MLLSKLSSSIVWIFDLILLQNVLIFSRSLIFYSVLLEMRMFLVLYSILIFSKCAIIMLVSEVAQQKFFWSLTIAYLLRLAEKMFNLLKSKELIRVKWKQFIALWKLYAWMIFNTNVLCILVSVFHCFVELTWWSLPLKL